MSNVFSNASFAVLSVVNFHNPNLPNGPAVWKGSTAYVQKKPEADFGNITVINFDAADWSIDDFNVQARFDANIAANIQSEINQMVAIPGGEISHVPTMSNSDISPKTYVMTAVEVT